jgi:acyl transferase domain-containing protein
LTEFLRIVDFKDGRLRVVCYLAPWPKTTKYRRVSVNGFGYGGANAHVILDATDCFLRRATYPSTVVNGHNLGPSNAKKYLLAFSAHNQATLVRNRDAILSVASKHEIPDLAYTLAAHRSRFQHRGFSIWNNDRSSTGVQDSKFELGVSRNIASNIAFVFTGEYTHL